MEFCHLEVVVLGSLYEHLDLSKHSPKNVWYSSLNIGTLDFHGTLFIDIWTEAGKEVYVQLRMPAPKEVHHRGR